MADNTNGALTRPLDGMFVLVVEDYEDARTLFATLLTMAGAHVTAVATVADAKAALERAEFGVLVSDLNLPDEDGYDLIRHVRSLDGAIGRTPAIAVTAQEGDDVRQRAIDGGYQRFLDKPLDASDLVDAIAELVGTESSRTEPGEG